MLRTTLLISIVVIVGTSMSSNAIGEAQGVKTLDADCGYNFLPHEKRQLRRAGWQCDKADVAVAKQMKKRGFVARQFVDAYALTHDIPRTTAKDVETVAVLSLVDVNPRYYFMIDEPKRPSLTAYYNRKLCRRGRILTIVGYSVALIGAGITAWGATMFKDDDYAVIPPGLGVVLAGASALIAGTSVGSIGVHKLRLISREHILDTGSMETLRKRRTKTHHFAPDDLIDYQMGAPARRIVGSISPVVGENVIGVAAGITF